MQLKRILINLNKQFRKWLNKPEHVDVGDRIICLKNNKKAEYIITVADKILDGSIEKNEIERSLQKAEEYAKASIDGRLRGEALRVRMYELAEMIFAQSQSRTLVPQFPLSL